MDIDYSADEEKTRAPDPKQPLISSCFHEEKKENTPRTFVSAVRRTINS